ncbi:long-chain-fatty-acid--CoA ligase [Pseudonocardia endophytica]|uniref:Long-chain acyl-CoA synthetase n=1 Tax=Pseudonocardia endophytica TaxID=401976 RepID=A0A4R1HZG6_PSEEN|nr:long-chain-fatty-acid--CoA ligase [Pseudonocardia endophytica]TCK26300.1 long-chain acyl-CoA synthetase [Pseudonocardia endophytica]
MAFSLRALIEDRGRHDPDGVAIVEGDSVLTWSLLHERAKQTAAALHRDGARPGARVVYLGKNSAWFFPYLFGCAMAGAVATPVNWRLAVRELVEIVDDTEATVLLVDHELRSVVEQVEVAARRPLTVVDLGGGHGHWPGIEDWWGAADEPGPQVVADDAGDDIALQLYTSGTTGRPKGAMFAGRTNLRVLAQDIAPRWGLGPGETSMLSMPLFHMGGVAWAIAGLAQGARGVVVRDFVPAEVLDTMEREQVTTAFFVPAMLNALVAQPGADARSLGLRRVTYSGAPISTSALVAAMKTFRCDFVQIYGLTEATGAFAQLEPEDHDPSGPHAHLLRSAGRPYPWVEVQVVDAQGTTCGVDEIGEIWTRSEQNTVGYWRRPADSTTSITEDGWLRTGDLGRLDAEGRIFLVDRAKDLIISGGENVYPAEVENELAAHPDVAEVAVIGVPHERWGETVKAVVVPRAGAEPDAADLVAFARTRLAAFKCPTTVDLVEELPRTATGKVVKGELREPYWRGHDRRIN